jgi:hypothetical protein
MAHEYANVSPIQCLLVLTLKGHRSGQPPTLFKEPLSFLSLVVQGLTAKEKEGLARTQWFRSKGLGYFAEQSTQPQTLGYSLADSPVGLLAWIYEKLHNWTDNYPWDDDEGELCGVKLA